MDLVDKIYHVRIVDARIADFDNFRSEVEVELEVLDGPIAGSYLSTRLDDPARDKYLKETK